MPETFCVDGHRLTRVPSNCTILPCGSRQQCVITDTVSIFDGRKGFLEGLIRIAGDLFAGCFDSIAGLGEILFADQVRQHFVLNLDFANRVVGDLFGNGRHRSDLGSFPLHFLAGRRNHTHGFDAIEGVPHRWYRYW